MLDPEAFYDDLAEDYHLIFPDWRRSVREHTGVLDRIIRAELGDRPARVLDCTSGIGTQAIGLALRGHAVTASDLSPKSIERARREAASFGVDMTFHVADVRQVADVVPGTFDVVLSGGNSLTHLLTDADLRTALENMRRKLEPGGLVMISIRDYGPHADERTRFVPPVLTGGPDNRAIVFQLWDWAGDGRTVDPTLLILREGRAGWTMTTRAMRYRALRRMELSRLMAEAGFSGVRWEGPDRTGTDYPPVVTARNPSG